jgi:hypothetical protein
VEWEKIRAGHGMLREKFTYRAIRFRVFKNSRSGQISRVAATGSLKMNDRSKRKVVCAMTLGLAMSIGAFAAPASWYLWKSRLDGKTFCLQTSPGEGWERVAGPFKDSRCEIPA